ncbi:hypothetical protein LK08_04500 [Streptomyces sp. MUSC 125]|nr:hypothetical protein LK08_04500 [Streptomyces sp. MUSC 125]
MLAVPLARDSTSALRMRLRWCERAKAVQTLPLVKRRRRTRVPLPSLGEGGGGVAVRADTWKEAAEADQVGGEDVGLLGGKRGEVQAARRGMEEGRANLAGSLQPAEDGGFGAVRVRPTRAQRLGHRQRDGVQGRARVQEVLGVSEKAVEVFGDVPVIRTHAS